MAQRISEEKIAVVYEFYGPSYYGRRNKRLARPVSKAVARPCDRLVNFSGRRTGTLKRHEIRRFLGGLSFDGWLVDWGDYISWTNSDYMQLINADEVLS